MGLSGKEMGIEEVKAYIEEAFQTGEATKIREAIKYLNEKKEKVTQEKLGVDYIERPEDTHLVAILRKHSYITCLKAQVLRGLKTIFTKTLCQTLIEKIWNS
jgi:hypothetical protein